MISIYFYETNHQDNILIFDKIEKIEIWINWACYVFIWKIHKRPVDCRNPVEWFLKLLNEGGVDTVLGNMISKRQYKSYEFVKERLAQILEDLKIVNFKDFRITLLSA